MQEFMTYDSSRTLEDKSFLRTKMSAIPVVNVMQPVAQAGPKVTFAPSQSLTKSKLVIDAPLVDRLSAFQISVFFFFHFPTFFTHFGRVFGEFRLVISYLSMSACSEHRKQAHMAHESCTLQLVRSHDTWNFERSGVAYSCKYVNWSETVS